MADMFLIAKRSFCYQPIARDHTALRPKAVPETEQDRKPCP